MGHTDGPWDHPEIASNPQHGDCARLLPRTRTQQVRREQIVTHNPLFAAVVLPNMIKELVGWKKQ